MIEINKLFLPNCFLLTVYSDEYTKLERILIREYSCEGLKLKAFHLITLTIVPSSQIWRKFSGTNAR